MSIPEKPSMLKFALNLFSHIFFLGSVAQLFWLLPKLYQEMANDDKSDALETALWTSMFLLIAFFFFLVLRTHFYSRD